MTNERHDDEVLGRALSRAIETQEPNETPYERSRIAERPARRGFALWQIAGAAAALVFALALGSWFTRPTDTGPVAASPTSAPSSSAAGSSATPTPTPAATAKVAPDHKVTYFARDGLPPVAAPADPFGTAGSQDIAVLRITTRIGALQGATPPAGATNAFPARTQTLTIALSGGATAVKIDGDLVTMDFNVPQSDWKVRGAAQSLALLQQLVYTASEEPGIRRVLITENGGKPTRIDQLAVDKPLTRDEVDGYGVRAVAGIAGDGTGDVSPDELRLGTSYSVDTLAPGLARVVIQVDRTSGALPQGFTPKFDVAITQVVSEEATPADLGKFRLTVTVGGGDPKTGLEVIDRTPLRAIDTVRQGAGTMYKIALDAGYPWRVFTLANPSRIVIDIGGAPQAVSDRIAVYEPAPQKTIDSRISRTFTVSGVARVFEANVVWRVRDSSQKVVAQGHTTASLGTSPVWGTFSTPVTLPASVNGNVTLEVYETSAKDGSELGLVAIPLAVR